MNSSLFRLVLIAAALICLTTAELTGGAAIQANIDAIRKMIVGRTLIGKWKLSEDSNFRINSKLVMINEQSDRKKRASNMLNFFPVSNTIRWV